MTDAGLDDPVRSSLLGRHASLARRRGRAVAYDPEVATFCAVPPDPTDEDWDDLAALLGPDGFVDLFSSPATPPGHWAQVFGMRGVQLVAPQPLARPAAWTAEAAIVPLGPADVEEMLALVARTRPGPFWPRTIAMGDYLGVREHGRLVAMAGERMRPPGATEISAVCTAPEARGRGLAAALVTAVASGILARGERPFLHVVDGNPALGLYLRLGFEVRREVRFHGYRVPVA